MNASVQRQLPLEPTGAAHSAAHLAHQAELHADLNRAHVRFINLGKTYQGQQGPVDALQNIDLAIQRGEIFGIIGRSGAGKSSLIRTINRLEQPSSGRVLIEQTDIGEFNEDKLVELRRRIGMIFQHFNLMSAKTVWQNVELPLKVAGVPKDQRQRKVTELLELVGLQDKHKAYPAQLSGGQKQRVGIARALVHDPAILLCDEATSALDPETTQSILGLLREINQRLGLTIILITHEMAVIRGSWCLNKAASSSKARCGKCSVTRSMKSAKPCLRRCSMACRKICRHGLPSSPKRRKPRSYWICTSPATAAKNRIWQHYLPHWAVASVCCKAALSGFRGTPSATCCCRWPTPPTASTPY